MELRHRDRIVQIKIVYYGPPLGGKTTNLQMLHAAAQGRHRGDFISVNSAQDRTILFDLLPLKGVGLHGFEIRFQLVAAPGHVQFAQTRRLVIRGADAVVFVANSATDRLQENVSSLREMAEYLAMNQLDPATIPLVFQHNKRDLPDVLSSRELEKTLGYRRVPHWPAVAIRGEGVLETLGAVTQQTLDHLMGRYRSLTLAPDESVEGWTSGMLQRIFGGHSIARPEPVEAPPTREGRQLVRVSVPRARAVGDPDSTEPKGVPGLPKIPGDTGQPMPEPPPHSALADSYAQAAMDLSFALQRALDERDVAQRCLDEVEHTLRAIEAVEQGRPQEETLKEVLHHIVVGARARGATLFGANADRTVRRVTGVGLPEDPLLKQPNGGETIRRIFVPLRKPTLVQPEKEPEIAQAVARLEPPVTAVTGVPIRSALGLHGLILLYYGEADPLPSPAILAHLGDLARALAAWFSVKRAVAITTSARNKPQAVAVPEIESSARVALDLVRAARRNPNVAARALETAEKKLDGILLELERFNANAAVPARAPLPPTKSSAGR